MSIKAMNWAWDVNLQPAVKLVLLKLADRANDDGECWPGQESIATACNMSERSVVRHIADLEKHGLLVVMRRKNDSGKQETNLYKLNIGAVRIAGPGDKLSPGKNDDFGPEPGDNHGKSRVTTVSPDIKEEPPVEPSVRAREVVLEKTEHRFLIADELYDRWLETYRRMVDPDRWSKDLTENWLETELAKASNYVLDPQHPKRLKQYRDWKKFLINWLERSLKPVGKSIRSSTIKQARHA